MPCINLWIPKARELLLGTVCKHDLLIEQTFVPTLGVLKDCLDCRVQFLLENEYSLCVCKYEKHAKKWLREF